MDERELFDIFQKQTKEDLIKLLKFSYSEMNSNQRAMVFDGIIRQTIKTKKNIDEKEILSDVKEFYKKSLAGYYYAPFMIDSKNFMDTPEETDEWCNKIGLLLTKTSQLTALNKHKTAVICFQKLFELMDKLGDDEIIFADEVGTWMIGGDDKKAVKSYITSLAKIATPKEFVKHTIPLLIRDSYESFSNKTYAQAKVLAGKEKMTELNKTIKKQGVRIK